jgi:hypothetical protein
MVGTILRRFALTVVQVSEYIPIYFLISSIYEQKAERWLRAAPMFSGAASFRRHIMRDLSRRSFLAASVQIAVTSALPVAPAWLRMLAEQPSASSFYPLTDGWEYFQGSLDGPWEVWNSSEIAVWETVALPHCFNHYDACDPDIPAYRGPGWFGPIWYWQIPIRRVARSSTLEEQGRLRMSIWKILIWASTLADTTSS